MITIPANTASATATVTVDPLQDLIAEGNETIIFGGAVGDGTTFSVDAATLTLSDDDTASTGIALSVSPTSLLESASSTAVTLTARLNAGAYDDEHDGGAEPGRRGGVGHGQGLHFHADHAADDHDCGRCGFGHGHHQHRPN